MEEMKGTEEEEAIIETVISHIEEMDKKSSPIEEEEARREALEEEDHSLLSATLLIDSIEIGKMRNMTKREWTSQKSSRDQSRQNSGSLQIGATSKQKAKLRLSLSQTKKKSSSNGMTAVAAGGTTTTTTISQAGVTTITELKADPIDRELLTTAHRTEADFIMKTIGETIQADLTETREMPEEI